MLVGRSEELSRIDSLLDEARSSRSASLIFAGEPGIGKTSLLEAAAERAGGLGFTVLRARGIESEAELAFSGLLELSRPIRAHVDRLPEPQAAALRSALALGPSEHGDRFAVYAATLGLLASASEETPVLLLLDDAHWLDAASGEAFAFAARRLGPEEVAMLWAVRTDDSVAFSLEGLERHDVGGLDRQASGDLVEQTFGSSIAASAVDRLFEATAGNPLALLETPQLLNESQLAGDEAIDQLLPAGPSVERTFGRRLDQLPESARQALLIAAVSSTTDLDTIERALATEGLAVVVFDPAEQAGIVVIEAGRIGFRHPLVRATVHGRATAAERRAAHAALAAALTDEQRSDERIWHRALAVVGSDDEVAAELEAAGVRAEATSLRAAERAFESAARLSSGNEDRARRALAAAKAAYTGGRAEAAAELLAEAVQLGDGDLGPDADLLGARVLAARGEMRRAAQKLEDAALRAEESDPRQAALMLVDAAQYWNEVGEDARLNSASERAWKLPWPRGGATEVTLALMYGDFLAAHGRLAEARKLWLSIADVPADGDPETLTRIADAVVAAGQDEQARVAAERAVERARECSALAVLPIALGVLALAQVRIGRLRSAAASAGEAVELGRALGQRGEQQERLARLAWVEGLLGREQESRRHAAEVGEMLDAIGYDGTVGGSGLGALELSLGNPREAIEAFEATLRVRKERIRGDALSTRPVLADLVEAYVRADRVDDARRTLTDVRRQAEDCGIPFALAAAARSRGLVEGEERYFLDALAWHERQPDPFQRGRTLLCYGELLRREKRRAEARLRLDAALTDFEDIGAASWAERARVELRASGERARRRVPDTRGDLTPQELQVAALVTEGLTNREIATRLFLSPKTIETHLRHAFQKLGVRSRTELAVAFSTPSREPSSHV